MGVLGLSGLTVTTNHSPGSDLVMKTHGHCLSGCSCLALSAEILSMPLSVLRALEFSRVVFGSL